MRHEHALQLADVLERQSELNTSVAKALQSVALSADRHDADIAELRDEFHALANRIEAVAQAVAASDRARWASEQLHSVRVDP